MIRTTVRPGVQWLMCRSTTDGGRVLSAILQFPDEVLDEVPADSGRRCGVLRPADSADLPGGSCRRMPEGR